MTNTSVTPETPALPAEPVPLTAAWFDALITRNQQAAAQKLNEYHEIAGAIAMLQWQRSLLTNPA